MPRKNAPPPKATPRRKRPRWLLALPIGILLGSVLLFSFVFSPQNQPIGFGTARFDFRRPDNGSGLPRSADCRQCHEEIFREWEASHHALANRLPDERDTSAFRSTDLPPGHAASLASSGPRLLLPAIEGPQWFPVDMILGHDPLRQGLIPWPDGGWQVTQIAFDPHRLDWFSVYEDDRAAGEWGSWTGRGMNWNASCAYCHMTDFRKNFDPEANLYASTWHEQGVGCIQCHPAIHGTSDSTTNPGRTPFCGPLTSAPTFDNCASCHSRRADFNGEFKPGEAYADFFHLQLPTQEGLYYADGQIRDEVYVWTSFRMSAMGHAGVDCLDCHNPHSNQLILPVENNALCMRCHTAPGLEGAPPIDPLAHSFHPAGSTSHQCVSCHMPHTTYMARDPRRDHGFHNPDPRLTLELGIPNACARCHQGQDPQTDSISTENLAQTAESWWGTNMNAFNRQRARIVHAAYNGTLDSPQPLLDLLPGTQNPYHLATYLELLQPWPQNEQVREASHRYINAENPRLRAAAQLILAADDPATARKGLGDTTRSVRLTTARLRPDLLADFPSVAAEEMTRMRYNADQPHGALDLARHHARLGDTTKADDWFRRALAYDTLSDGIPHEFGLHLHRTGRTAEARSQLQKAANIARQNPLPAFHLALLEAESGRSPEAENALRQAIATAPEFDRAHYNLGLLLASREQLTQAIAALMQAEKHNPREPAYPYARATIHLRMGDTEAATRAARKALEIAPDYRPALELLAR